MSMSVRVQRHYKANPVMHDNGHNVRIVCIVRVVWAASTLDVSCAEDGRLFRDMVYTCVSTGAVLDIVSVIPR